MLLQLSQDALVEKSLTQRQSCLLLYVQSIRLGDDLFLSRSVESFRIRLFLLVHEVQKDLQPLRRDLLQIVVVHQTLRAHR